MTQRVRIRLENRLPEVRLGLGMPKTRATMTMAPLLKGDKGDMPTADDIRAAMPAITVLDWEGNTVATFYGTQP